MGRFCLVGFPALDLPDKICWVGRLGWVFWVVFFELGLLLGRVAGWGLLV